MYQRIMHTPVPHLGHVKQKHDFVEDETSQMNEIEPSVLETSEQSEIQPVPIAFLKKLLVQAISWYYTHRTILSLSDSANLKIYHVPFMSSTSGDLYNTIMFTSHELDDQPDEEQLDILLKSWDHSRHKVPRDGNCLFNAAAFNIKMQLTEGNSDLEQVLIPLDICIQDSQSLIASSLRKLVVEEWLGEHAKYYQQFMTENQLQSQAEEFLCDGVYSSDIGDLAVAALSNVLQTALVLFTSRPNQPLHIQHPTTSPVINSNPIYLSYLQRGSGHYDAVIPTSIMQDKGLRPTNLEIVTSKSCTCGRNSSKGDVCSFSLSQYSCRCPCYNNKEPCTQRCKCKGCTNTFGRKTAVEPSKSGQKRKRLPHDSQAVQLKGKKTVHFMTEVGEPMSVGGFSLMEYLIVCSIIQTMNMDFDWGQSRNVSTSEVCTMYSYLLELLQTLNVDIALFGRSEEKIQKLLGKISFQWELHRQKNMVLKVVKK